jgi:hypothetical protein
VSSFYILYKIMLVKRVYPRLFSKNVGEYIHQSLADAIKPLLERLFTADTVDKKM